MPLLDIGLLYGELLERARTKTWALVGYSSLQGGARNYPLSRKKIVLFFHITNLLLIKLVRSRLLDINLIPSKPHARSITDMHIRSFSRHTFLSGKLLSQIEKKLRILLSLQLFNSIKLKKSNNK